MSTKRGLNLHRNERGMLTLDFVFALLLAIGFTTVLFAITVTLSMVEVSQYVVFSISRVYAGAHETPTLQSDLAKQKYDQVLEYPVFRALYRGDWFTVGEPQLGNFSAEYPEVESDNQIFEGAKLPINAKILHLRLPFLGSTAREMTTGQAVLNSYLMREVSGTECRENFARARYSKILELTSDSGTPYQAASGGSMKLITDNGC